MLWYVICMIQSPAQSRDIGLEFENELGTQYKIIQWPFLAVSTRAELISIELGSQYV